jgi:phosphohistidine phosphatase
LYCSPFSLTGWLRLPTALLDRLRGRNAYRERTFFVVRHATAERRSGGQTDRDRALTASGRIDAERLGEMLARRALVPDIILTSPATRARETAEIVALASGFSGGVTEIESLYQASPRDLLAALVAHGGASRRALLVGHDPTVSELVTSLAGSSYEGLPTGGMAMLRAVARDWSELGGDSRVTLAGLWRPADHVAAVARDILSPSREKWAAAYPDERVSDVARRTFEGRFAVLDDALGVALSPGVAEPDAIRRLRVAARRADAVLRTYGDVFPRKRSERLREELRRIRRATRRVRDDDVLALQLEPRASEPCVATLLALLRSQQIDPRPALAELRAGRIDGSSLGERAATMIATLERRSGRGVGRERFQEWALRRYEESADRYRSAETGFDPETADVEALHDLRLAGKKLRYEIELLAAVLPDDVKTRVYPYLVETQDRLGAVSDSAAAAARLKRLVAELDATHPRDEVEAVLASECMRLDEARAEAVAFLTAEKIGSGTIFPP